MNENNTNNNNTNSNNLEKQETVNQSGVNTPNEPVGPTTSDNITSHVVATPTTEAPQEVPVTEEKKEEPAYVEDEKGGPSKLKTFFAIILFLFFFAFVYFLPEITDYVNLKKSERNQTEITTGTLSCTQSKNTKTLDVNLTAVFTFVNNEITQLTYTQTSTGDKIADKEELEKLRQDCVNLKEHIIDVEGISVVCGLNNGTNTTKQIIDYEKVDSENVSSAYIEAGGIYPEFKKNEKISEVESKMASSSYKCEKY